MKWLVGGVAIAVLAMGCGGSAESPNGPPGEDQKEIACGAYTLRFEEFYGFCHEGCLGKLTLSSDGAGRTVRADYPARPETTRDFTLNAEELEAVEATLESGLSIPWDAMYGCPDCADQGVYSLEVEFCDGRRTTVVDPRQQPEALKPLLATLRDLIRTYEP